MKERTRASPASAIHTAVFCLGTAAGFLLAARLTRAGELSLTGLLAGWGQAIQSGVEPSLPILVWDNLRWPLFAWCLGLTTLGVWLLPLAFFARGFALGYCVAGLAGAWTGPLPALLLFGLPSAVTVPIFFTLGFRSWRTAVGIRSGLFPGKRDRGLYPPIYWVQSLLALGVLLLWTLVEFFLFPPLLEITIP